MPRKKAAVEDRVLRAAKLCIDNPKLPVPKAMLAEQFTLAESKDKTQQMKVRRCIKGMTSPWWVLDLYVNPLNAL